MINNTQSAQISQNKDGRNIHAIMKTMCPSWFSPQWLCGNSCNWAHDVRLCIVVPMNQSVLNKQSKEGIKEPKSPGGHIFFMIACIYITSILLLWDLSTLCVVDHLWPLIYIHIYHYIRQTITNSRFHATLCFIHVLLNFLQTWYLFFQIISYKYNIGYKLR